MCQSSLLLHLRFVFFTVVLWFCFTIDPLLIFVLSWIKGVVWRQSKHEHIGASLVVVKITTETGHCLSDSWSGPFWLFPVIMSRYSAIDVMKSTLLGLHRKKFTRSWSWLTKHQYDALWWFSYPVYSLLLATTTDCALACHGNPRIFLLRFSNLFALFHSLCTSVLRLENQILGRSGSIFARWHRNIVFPQCQ